MSDCKHEMKERECNAVFELCSKCGQSPDDVEIETLKAKVKEAFIAGFKLSGEGCHGDYGASDSDIAYSAEEWVKEVGK